jgi:AhpD family alkylhydroperoxidase
MDAFRRRHYHRPGELWRDLVGIVRSRSHLQSAMRGTVLSAAFRERLMMVVTAVNDCRYCSYAHTRLALRSGVSDAEIRDLLAGSVPQDAPAHELVALAYAQHWAERDAAPDYQERQRLLDTYGVDTADAIDTVLRMIRAANLAGNTWDALLHRVSFGRLGA